jgi:hypothetical protein
VAISDWSIPFRVDRVSGPLDLKCSVRCRSEDTRSDK